MTTNNENIWHRGYKIPWDEPDFSRRMLAMHLSQDHDMASRRSEWIDKQVEWIHDDLLGEQSANILDLGCGPGFYSHRLTMRGHCCHGIDFGPASVDYARQHNPDESRCDFVLGDIREVQFGGPYDLAMILFGELNVFSPAEAIAILCKTQASLNPQGKLIVEIQTAEAVESVGRSEPNERHFESGLFSDRPHHCLTQNQWLPEHQVTIQTFYVTETENGQTQQFHSTTKAWQDNELIELLKNAGFKNPTQQNEWPSNTEGLKLWIAKKI